MIAYQAGANSGDLISADLGADAAAAYGDAALHLAGRNGAGERNDEIGIIVAWDEAVRAEVDDFMPGRLETAKQIFFQTESAVIGCDSYAHITPNWQTTKNDRPPHQR